MSKQVSAKELAGIVTRLLTDPIGNGELDSFESFQSFMTDIAKVLCDHCGGEVRNGASQLDDTWYVGIHGNDSMPDAFGGIWREYDPEGVLFDEDVSVRSIECIVSVTGNSTEGGDENVPGQYGIEVILSRPVCIFSLTQVEKSEIAKSVLDCFHQHQGIECLDDFEITATLPNGQVISEDDESAATGLVKSTDHLGKLSVRIHDFDLPADLDPRFREQTRQLREITDILNMQVDPHSECNNCGAMIDSILGCPGGAEICQDCFDSGSH